MSELFKIKGAGPVLTKACTDAGHSRVEQIVAAVRHDLVAVPWITKVRSKLVIAAARDLLRPGLKM